MLFTLSHNNCYGVFNLEKIIGKQKGFREASVEKSLTPQLEECLLVGLDLYKNDEKAFLNDLYKLCSQKFSQPLERKQRSDDTVEIFDMGKLRQCYENASTSEKAVKAILKKFNLSEDTGYRKLAPVTKPFIDGLRALKKSYPNCIEFLDYVDQFGALSLCRENTMKMYFPPVILAGPPGVGKTAIVREVARLLGVAYKQLDMATVTSSFVISGASSVWSDAKTGCIVDLLRDAHAANPMVILDELDKVSKDQKHDPLGGLYTLLEQESAEKFTDEALDIKMDASHILYVATANDLTLIPEPLLSRFLVINIDDVKGKHHRIVTQSIYSSIIKNEKMERAFKENITEDVFDLLEPFSPREVKRILMRAMAKSACRMQSNYELKIEEGDLMLPSDDEKRIGFVW